MTTAQLNKSLRKKLSKMTRQEVLEFGEKLGANYITDPANLKDFQISYAVAYKWAETIKKATAIA